MFSNQIKSNHRIFENLQIKSNQIMRQKIGFKSNQIKSNHDLICISNQNFGCHQNQATSRAKSRFHGQIMHRSKGLSELFLSVPLVSPESMIAIQKCIDNDFDCFDQIKSNHGNRASNQIKSQYFEKAPNQIKSRGLKNESNQIKSECPKIASNQFKSNQIMI